MPTSTKVNAKKAIVNADLSAKKNNTPTVKNASNTPVKSVIAAINLSAFKDVLESKNVEKTQKDRQHLYNYPEDFAPSDLNGEKGKKFRQSLRNKMQRFSNNIFFYTKTEDVEKLKIEIADFETFYKTNYRLNDFTVKSISASEKQTNDLTIMLDIIKSVKEQSA